MSSPNDTAELTAVDAEPHTILVIDDDQLMRELLERWLSAEGYRTVAADDGESGLRLFHEQSFDLVLTDLVMPGVDGFGVLATIHQECPDLPVIIVSGAGDLQDSIKALRLGAWDYLTKPVDPPSLFHQVNKALERASLLKENARYRESLQQQVEQRTAQLQQRSSELEEANLHLEREIHIRQQAEAKLQAANASWQTTFDSMPDFISILDLDFTVLQVNKSLADFLGHPPEELIGRKCYELFHASGAPWHNCPHRELLNSGQPHTAEVVDPHLGKPLMISVSPIRSEGKLVGSIHIAKDITQQKRLEEERQKNKNLESIAILCGGLAHDFNNLLTALSGYIDLAKMEKAADRLPQWLDSAKMVTNMAADLTKQLLIFSKGGAPVFSHIATPFLLEDSLEHQSRTFSKVQTELNVPADIWSINGDHGQLRTVIRNLFYNAAEAMPDGGLLRIEARNVPKQPSGQAGQGEASPLVGDAVLLRFTDHGVGIRPEIINKIFDPYFTTCAKGAAKGKGLGLSLCHSIIAKHHGQISVTSQPGQGTTVAVYLPASSGTASR